MVIPVDKVGGYLRGGSLHNEINFLDLEAYLSLFRYDLQFQLPETYNSSILMQFPLCQGLAEQGKIVCFSLLLLLIY